VQWSLQLESQTRARTTFSTLLYGVPFHSIHASRRPEYTKIIVPVTGHRAHVRISKTKSRNRPERAQNFKISHARGVFRSKRRGALTDANFDGIGSPFDISRATLALLEASTNNKSAVFQFTVICTQSEMNRVSCNWKELPEIRRPRASTTGS
jgi:hypothetical protein